MEGPVPLGSVRGGLLCLRLAPRGELSPPQRQALVCSRCGAGGLSLWGLCAWEGGCQGLGGGGGGTLGPGQSPAVGIRVPHLGCQGEAGGAAVLGIWMVGGRMDGQGLPLRGTVPRRSRLQGPHAEGFDRQPCPFSLSSPCRGCLHKPAPPPVH